MRTMAFPGNIHLPACRVREGSPHLKTYARFIWRLKDSQPEIGASAVRARNGDGGERVIDLPSGLVFESTTTATILLRVIDALRMRSKPAYFSRTDRAGRDLVLETRFFVSFGELLAHMKKDFPAGEPGASERLAAEGVLIRPRKVAIAAIPNGGGEYCELGGRRTYLVRGNGIDIGKIMILNGSMDLVREIIQLEAEASATQEGNGRSRELKGIRRSLLYDWKTELRVASYDTD
ncbi:MAG: hypothetical protein WC350_03060 [Candidatus Micrarchaeia archaeon]|jgi:hypothetical protein